jgi:hypothetical protein
MEGRHLAAVALLLRLVCSSALLQVESRQVQQYLK